MKYLALLVFLVGCNSAPKYSVGDCVVSLRDSSDEFLYDAHPRKILKIGKRNYLYSFSTRFPDLQGETSINIIDDYTQKVDCSSVGF